MLGCCLAKQNGEVYLKNALLPRDVVLHQLLAAGLDTALNWGKRMLQLRSLLSDVTVELSQVAVCGALSRERQDDIRRRHHLRARHGVKQGVGMTCRHLDRQLILWGLCLNVTSWYGDVVQRLFGMGIFWIVWQPRTPDLKCS